MAMHVPKNAVTLGRWAADLVATCSASQRERAQRGALFRNLFLTGSPDGNPATYPKTTPFIENVAAYLYSPVELRFSIDPDDPGQPDEVAMARGAERRLHKKMRRGNVDTKIDGAVLWSLVKGKAFLQTLWNRDGFECHVVQPEMIGVYREDLMTLDQQEAFFFSTYVTYGQFELIVRNHPRREQLLQKARRHVSPKGDATSPDKMNFLKQVIIGGLNPLGSPNDTSNPNTGLVQWLQSPQPSFAPEVLAGLLRIDELWVQDAEMEDWTTIQLIGDDCVIEGDLVHRNAFADPMDIRDKDLLKKSREDNPLAGQHPFTEFCPNELEGYFWGRSELFGLALLQESLNARINGINSLLRRQENPPRAISGNSTISQAVYAKLNKAGGYLTSSDPQLKVQTLAPELPPDLWVDKHEIEAMMDDIGGFTATMRGKGEGGIRAQSHAETLIRTGSPRFKLRALKTERSVEAVGGQMLDILRARDPKKLSSWMKPHEGDLGISAPEPWWKRMFVAPAAGMKRLEFIMHDVPEDFSVHVDSHSSSPAFSQEAKELAFALARQQAIDAPQLIALTHPPHEEALISDAEAKMIAHDKLIAEHPELLEKGGKKKK